MRVKLAFSRAAALMLAAAMATCILLTACGGSSGSSGNHSGTGKADSSTTTPDSGSDTTGGKTDTGDSGDDSTDEESTPLATVAFDGGSVAFASSKIYKSLEFSKGNYGRLGYNMLVTGTAYFFDGEIRPVYEVQNYKQTDNSTFNCVYDYYGFGNHDLVSVHWQNYTSNGRQDYTYLIYDKVVNVSSSYTDMMFSLEVPQANYNSAKLLTGTATINGKAYYFERAYYLSTSSSFCDYCFDSTGSLKYVLTWSGSNVSTCFEIDKLEKINSLNIESLKPTGYESYTVKNIT